MIEIFIMDLLRKTYCRLKPSKVHGIGVFAIRDIPKGINPFESLRERGRIIRLREEEVATLHPEVAQMVRDFFYPDENGLYPVISTGLDSINVSYYLNHSDTPNVSLIDQGESYYSFMTRVKISAGEELFINYHEHPELDI